MNIAVVTLSVPPFSYRSLWWWILSNHESSIPGSLELVGPSGKHQFQKQTLEHGEAHLLNIYADEGGAWSERERNEFVVKSHVYLSKLQRSDTFDRILVSGCSGAEPLMTGILSSIAPVWVQPPAEVTSPRGELGYGLMDCAERTIRFDVRGGSGDEDWPPVEEAVADVIERLFSGGST